MKQAQNTFRNQLKQNKSLFHKFDPADKQNNLKKGNLQRLRIISSVHNAGHVRGGHGFH